MDWEKHRYAEARDSLQDGAQAIEIIGILRAMKREKKIGLWLEVKLPKDGLRVSLRNGAVLHQSVKQDIANDDDTPTKRIVWNGNPLTVKSGRILVGGDKKHLTQVIGNDAVLFFGLSVVIASATCFHMRERKLQPGGE